MAKYNYNFSYIDKGNIKRINVDGKWGSFASIEQVDKFTTHFENEEKLLEHLKRIHVIPNYVNKIYISYDIEEYGMCGQRIKFDGHVLLFKNDVMFLKDEKGKTTTKHVYYVFNLYHTNYDKLLKLANLYVNKYKNSNEAMYNRAKGFRKYALSLTDRDFTRSEIDEMYEYYKDFFDIEFFRYSKGKKIPKYGSVRDLLVKERYVEGIYDIDNIPDFSIYNPYAEVIEKNSSSNGIIENEYLDYETEVLQMINDKELSLEESIESAKSYYLKLGNGD